MKGAVQHILERCAWVQADVHIWVDFISTPQANQHTQKLAINSFVHFASCAHAFVVIAPPVPHMDKEGYMCNIDTYRGRMWCRAEQLSHYLRNGQSSMYVATASSALSGKSSRDIADGGPGEQSPPESSSAVMAMDDADEKVGRWHEEYLQVFHGDATVETDKISLVLPLLGLYGELLSTQARGRSGESSKAHEGGSMERVNAVLTKIRGRRDEIFPAQLTIGEGKLVDRAYAEQEPRGLGKSDVFLGNQQSVMATKVLTLELFGDLTERMEKLVGTSDETRAYLKQKSEFARSSAVPTAVSPSDGRESDLISRDLRRHSSARRSCATSARQSRATSLTEPQADQRRPVWKLLSSVPLLNSIISSKSIVRRECLLQGALAVTNGHGESEMSAAVPLAATPSDKSAELPPRQGARVHYA